MEGIHVRNNIKTLWRHSEESSEEIFSGPTVTCGVVLQGKLAEPVRKEKIIIYPKNAVRHLIALKNSEQRSRSARTLHVLTSKGFQIRCDCSADQEP